MSLSIYQLLGDFNPFLDRIFQYLSAKKVDVKRYELDHICYRVETEERYQALKKSLTSIGELLTESQIGGRAIASIKLKKPIVYKDRKIWVIELPAPKKGSFYKEGFEHVEFVIDVPFEAFLFPGFRFQKNPVRYSDYTIDDQEKEKVKNKKFESLNFFDLQNG